MNRQTKVSCVDMIHPFLDDPSSPLFILLLLPLAFVRLFIKMKTSLLVNQSTEMQTCPPPRAIFSALVTQWAIYDRWEYVPHLVELVIFGSRFQSKGLNWKCEGTWLMRLPRRRRRTEQRRPSKRFFLLSCRFFCEKKMKTLQNVQRTREFIVSNRHLTVTKPRKVFVKLLPNFLRHQPHQ